MALKSAAIKPVRSDPYAVSLIRQKIGDDESKRAAIANVHKTDFWGFGAATAANLMPHARAIEDDRAAFFGHANLEITYDIPRGEPNSPPVITAEYELAISNLLALAKEFRIFKDEGDDASKWGGSPLRLAS